MSTIHAIFEGGVFRPTQRVDLPENTAVEFEPRLVDGELAQLIAKVAQTDPGKAAVYEVLARRHNSGQHDAAERHNEHQP